MGPWLDDKVIKISEGDKIIWSGRRWREGYEVCGDEVGRECSVGDGWRECGENGSRLGFGRGLF